MSDPFRPRIGGTLSADIAVPEHEREVRFYARVLSTGERPLWRENDLMNNLGMPIIGLGERTAEYAELPLQWMPHIQVADVATSVQRTIERGGQAMMHARDEEGRSQWAVLLDPNGAAFGIIPVTQDHTFIRDGSEVGAVGRIAWLDLTVDNATETRDFYQQVVGWSTQNVEMKDGRDSYADYNMLGGDGRPEAGICHARGSNRGLPPVWLVYLAVGDLPESLRRVHDEGGKVISVVNGGDGNPAYAVVQDPVGASLALSR